MRSGEGPYRPTGTRVLWLEGFELPEDLWARLRIPIGLAFFMRSSSAGRRRRPLPEPGRGGRMRARRSEAWEELCAANPVLDGSRRTSRG